MSSLVGPYLPQMWGTVVAGLTSGIRSLNRVINYVIFRLSFGSPGPPFRTPPTHHHKGTPRGRNIDK